MAFTRYALSLTIALTLAWADAQSTTLFFSQFQEASSGNKKVG